MHASTLTCPDVESSIQAMLHLMRRHLGLDVALISHLTEDLRVVRFLDAVDDEVVEVGRADPAAGSYCRSVVAGQLPGLLHDPAQHPVSAAMGRPDRLADGTHLSVPIVLGDGRVYGTLCAFAHRVRPDLDERDLGMMHTLAGIIASQLEHVETLRVEREERARAFAALEVGHDLLIVFQPIVELVDERLVGAEALARFPGLSPGPAAVFADAWSVGQGVRLELVAARAALARLGELPGGVALSLNLSPGTLTDPRFAELLAEVDARRVVLEVSEHAALADAATVNRAMDRFRDDGARLAIDDVGAGLAGLDTILELRPELLKLDGRLVAGVDRRRDKQAMIAAMRTYAERMGIGLVAKCVETLEEHTTLLGLGVPYGQGFGLARPADVSALLRVGRGG